MATYYAVYQAGYEIIGVGHTPDEARADAESWSDHAPLEIIEYLTGGPLGEVHGAYYLRPTVWEVYEEVRRCGGSTPYMVDEHGRVMWEEESPESRPGRRSWRARS